MPTNESRPWQPRIAESAKGPGQVAGLFQSTSAALSGPTVPSPSIGEDITNREVQQPKPSIAINAISEERSKASTEEKPIPSQATEKTTAAAAPGEDFAPAEASSSSQSIVFLQTKVSQMSASTLSDCSL